MTSQGEQPFLPISARVKRLWESLTDAQREARLAAAKSRERIVEAISGAVKDGASERKAVQVHGEGTDRNTYRRWKRAHAKGALEGLIDLRYPPRLPVPSEIASAICAFREADPFVGVEAIKEHLRKHRDFIVSTSSIKRILKRAGLSLPRGRMRPGSHPGEERLELGGMVLVDAADVKIGYSDGLTSGAMSCVDQLEEPVDPPPLDTSDRDEYGRFLPSYNARSVKPEDAAVGPGFASVEEKRGLLVPERLHIKHAGRAAVQRKLLALMMGPALQLSRWADLRVADGQRLEALCGFPYMPSTLDLFARELKYVGVASTLWEIHARLWLAASKGWAGADATAVIYIDGLVKPIHSKLPCESSPVSSNGRVMPSLEVVSFHTAAGVPLWMVTHSGRTPLVKAVPELLDRIPEITGDPEIGRITIIDAEGNSVTYMKQLEGGSPRRSWVMRIKESILRNKHIFNRTNYRPYRPGERIRTGLVDLNDPDVRGGTFRVRIVELERANGQITYLAASTLLSQREWKGADIADLYFSRWPAQEANFRSVNQATGFKEVHGYGKQMVDNISVITKQDDIRKQIERLNAQQEKRLGRLEHIQEEAKANEKDLRRARRRQDTVERNIQKLNPGDTVSNRYKGLLDEQRDLRQSTAKLSAKVDRQHSEITDLEQKSERAEASIENKTARIEKLDRQKQVLRHDTELDSLFTLLKVGLSLLITYVLKEFMNGAVMEIETFLKRVATLPARRRLLPGIEIVTFEYNNRDPEVMALLASSCDNINKRGLTTRSGRTLRIAVDPAPPPLRPPPRGRAKTADRFRRC